MEQELKKLGLKPNEIKVYNTLLEIGENTVGPIIKKLGMHRQVAYDALKTLEEKKMVISTTKNNRFYFRIANPRNILENVKQQENVAKNLIEEIELKLKGQKKGQEIRIYEGEKAYRDLMRRKDDVQPANSEYLVVTGAAMKFQEIMDKTGGFELSNRTRLKKNIKTRLIYTGTSKFEAANFKRKNAEYRFLPKGYVSLTTFAIWHDSVNLVSYEGDMFCIEIKNDAFRKAYLNYFNILWKIAKK